jgi:hypothetical protein
MMESSQKTECAAGIYSAMPRVENAHLFRANGHSHVLSVARGEMFVV